MPRVSIDEGASHYQAVSNQVLQAFHQEGHRLPGQPSAAQQGAYDGTLPANTEELDNHKLAALLHQVSGWMSWVNGGMAACRTQLSHATHQLEFLRAGLRQAVAEASTKKMSAQDKDDVIALDPRAHEAELAMLYYEGRMDLYRMLSECGQRDWETVSRIITVRGQELERTRRGENVSNIPISQPSPFRRP
jgi:hypothetical protein